MTFTDRPSVVLFNRVVLFSQGIRPVGRCRSGIPLPRFGEIWRWYACMFLSEVARFNSIDLRMISPGSCIPHADNRTGLRKTRSCWSRPPVRYSYRHCRVRASTSAFEPWSAEDRPARTAKAHECSAEYQSFSHPCFPPSPPQPKRLRLPKDAATLTVSARSLKPHLTGRYCRRSPPTPPCRSIPVPGLRPYPCRSLPRSETNSAAWSIRLSAKYRGTRCRSHRS